MWRTWALGATLALGAFGSARAAGTTEVSTAMWEIMGMLPQMQCAAPEVWQVNADAEGATQFLMGKLQDRGWQVMDRGTTPHGYALIIDPNPNDPSAVAIGGLLSHKTEAANTAFLTQCHIKPQTGEDLFTLRSDAGGS